MLGMFDFMFMPPYEKRKVARFDGAGDVMVDTCAVTDSDQPFETAVAHPQYGDGEWIIVEAYDTREEAQAGHDKWVATMTAQDLPAELIDISTSGAAMLLREVKGGALIFPRMIETKQ